MNQNQKKIEAMWDSVYSGLKNIVGARYKEDYPEASLLLAIIVQAAKDSDIAWLYSANCKKLCWLLRLRHMYVLNIFIEAFHTVSEIEQGEK